MIRIQSKLSNTFIECYQKIPPIVFEEISNLYFYSDSLSIRNSRVKTYSYKIEVKTVVIHYYVYFDFLWVSLYIPCNKFMELQCQLHMTFYNAKFLFISRNLSKLLCMYFRWFRIFQTSRYQGIVKATVFGVLKSS